MHQVRKLSIYQKKKPKDLRFQWIHLATIQKSIVRKKLQLSEQQL
jgi:hypothetical protein